MMLMNLDDTAFLIISSVNYRCIISKISNSEAVYLLRNAELSEKSGKLQNVNFLTAYKNG